MKIKSYTIDLSEQMAVCDANYIRLLKLLGNTRTMNQRVVALPHLGHEDNFVCLEVLEDFKYTSTISIRQMLASEKNPDLYHSTDTALPGRAHSANSDEKETGRGNSELTHSDGRQAYYNTPEMIIRVYHDAKTAEVTSYQNHKYFKAIYPVPNQFMYQCDEKEQLNLFLAEWLNLCINEGLSNPGELQLDCLNCL